MPLIKNDSAARFCRTAVALDLDDLGAQGRRIIAEARREAEATVAEAVTAAERLRAEAREAGVDEGRREGLAAGREAGEQQARQETLESLRPQLEAVIESWRAALDRWEAERGAMLAEARQDVLTFALELGRRVVLRQVAADPGVVVDQVAEALGRLGRRTSVAVTIHPDDRDVLEEHLAGIRNRIDACEEVELRTDGSISRGGCLVRTAGGEIDATIETQLERIAAALVPGEAPAPSAASAGDP